MISAYIEKIEIEIHKPNSDPLIRVVVQKVAKDADGNITQIMGNSDEIFRRVSDVATEFVSYSDPVLQNQGEISIAGIADALAQTAFSWLPQEYDGEFTDGRFVFSEGQ